MFLKAKSLKSLSAHYSEVCLTRLSHDQIVYLAVYSLAFFISSRSHLLSSFSLQSSSFLSYFSPQCCSADHSEAPHTCWVQVWWITPLMSRFNSIHDVRFMISIWFNYQNILDTIEWQVLFLYNKQYKQSNTQFYLYNVKWLKNLNVCPFVSSPMFCPIMLHLVFTYHISGHVSRLVSLSYMLSWCPIMSCLILSPFVPSSSVTLCLFISSPVSRHVLVRFRQLSLSCLKPSVSSCPLPSLSFPIQWFSLSDKFWIVFTQYFLFLAFQINIINLNFICTVYIYLNPCLQNFLHEPWLKVMAPFKSMWDGEGAGLPDANENAY